MAEMHDAQREALIRGLRFDAAEEIDGGYRAGASSDDPQTGLRRAFEGVGETEEDAYAALIDALVRVPTPVAGPS